MSPSCWSPTIAKSWATEDELKKTDAEVRAIVNEASEFATHDAEYWEEWGRRNDIPIVAIRESTEG